MRLPLVGSSLSLVYYFNFHLIRTRGTAALIGYLNVRKLAIENWSTTQERMMTFPLKQELKNTFGRLDAWMHGLFILPTARLAFLKSQTATSRK